MMLANSARISPPREGASLGYKLCSRAATVCGPQLVGKCELWQSIDASTSIITTISAKGQHNFIVNSTFIACCGWCGQSRVFTRRTRVSHGGWLMRESPQDPVAIRPFHAARVRSNAVHYLNGGRSLSGCLSANQRATLHTRLNRAALLSCGPRTFRTRCSWPSS